jgi:hypothetical protein
MTTASSPAHVSTGESPITGFSQCHVGILSQLEAFAGLPELARAAEHARKVAADTLALFDSPVIEHHAEEEADLFPAAARSAAPGAEADNVQSMIERLTREHRVIEALWRRVKPAVRLVAQGKSADIDEAAIAELVRAYAAHARFEESEFLPLAQQILGRDGNHMAALGLSLHMRHVELPTAYI